MLTSIAKLLFDSFDAILATRNAIHLYFHEGLCCIHKFRAQKVQKERAATLCQCCCPLVVNDPKCDIGKITFAVWGTLRQRAPPIRIGESNDNRHFIGAASACGRFDSGFVLKRCEDGVSDFLEKLRLFKYNRIDFI